MTIILALDQGTSSSRAIVFDGAGSVLGAAAREFDSTFPADGWVEQDPEVLWRSTLQAGRAALAAAGVDGSGVAAIGISNQRETTLLWEAAGGRALHPAIVWQDRRGAPHCERLMREGVEAELIERTGLLIDPYFSATKLAWLLDHVGGARGRAAAGELCFGTVDSFLIWRLTKGASHVTDATNASRTQLFNLAEQAWDDALLELFGVPAAVLPEVRDSAGGFGVADADWFGAPIPILGVAGDQQAALIGQGCLAPGMTKGTYGTGCFVVANTGTTRVHSGERLLATVGYRLDGVTTYALEGSIFVAGVAVKWLRDKLGLIATPSDTEAMARSVGGDTGGVYLVPAFTGLGAPHWRPQARGLICGMTLDTTREDIVTAALQSVAYQSAELLAAMERDGARVSELRVDGGMVVNEWLCQFLADVLAVPVDRPAVTETTALGAAMLAALGSGTASSLEAAGMALWRSERRFEPRMSPEQRAALLAGWQGALRRTLI